ncbi:MAG: ABC transporter permease [Candidatus Bathyarchaeota archaeon]|nr:MAG: ABC transporter permease [Candidatus Bathyarchaeota archaeon]
MKKLGPFRLSNSAKIIVLLLLAVLVYALFFLGPLLWMFYNSFFRWDPLRLVDRSVVTMENYLKVFTHPLYQTGVINSFIVSTAATLLSLVFNFPVAYYMTKLKSQARAITTMIILTPMMTLSLVTSYAWLTLLTPGGLVNQFLMSIGIISEPIIFWGTRIGVILVLVYSFSPHMTLVLNASLENIDPNYIKAAQILGANRFQTFYKVILPMSVPGIVAGSILTFTMCISSFLSPYVMGGRVVKLMAVQVFDFISVQLNFPLGSAMAIVLLSVVLLMVYVIRSLAEKKFRGGT